MNTTEKHIIDLLAFMTAIGGILDYMPKIAALMSVIWLAVQLFDYFYKRKWRG